jgi:hypothetical protein
LEKTPEYSGVFFRIFDTNIGFLYFRFSCKQSSNKKKIISNHKHLSTNIHLFYKEHGDIHGDKALYSTNINIIVGGYDCSINQDSSNH